MPKPILKWVGGKTQILDKIIEKVPSIVHDYHERFVGGGSVLFEFLSQVKSGKIRLLGSVFASDLNEHLIHLYQHLQSSLPELLAELDLVIKDFYSITTTVVNRNPCNETEAKTSRESFYYWIRSQFNHLAFISKDASPKKSAMFLFLNKTGFRGMYREGPRGFNVPYGNYTKPEIYNKDHLIEISSLLRDVRFTVQDFTDSCKSVHKDDFVYLDPPYVPEVSSSFVSYTSSGFSYEKHLSLFECCRDIHSRGAKILMSNSCVKLVIDSFPTDTFTITEISCKRRINSKNPEAMTNEVLITN